MTPCITCGADLPESTPGSTPYNSLPGVVLIGIPVCTCTSCGEEYVSIPRIKDLDRLLAHHIAFKRGRLTGAEVRFLRKHVGWSGADFARYFQTDKSTVSRWEADKSVMHPPTELALRVIATRMEPIDDYASFEAMLLRPTESSVENSEIQARWEQDQWQMAA
jgi:putative transcriptional regulator